MARSATPATGNEATRHLKPPKMTPSAEITIGTAIRPSRARLRTVADGCGRLRTVANINATSSEHTLNPQTPRVKREPLLRIREKTQGFAPQSVFTRQFTRFRTVALSNYLMMGGWHDDVVDMMV